MEDISGLRGGQNHAPTATLATVSPTYSGRVTAGFRFIPFAARSQGFPAERAAQAAKSAAQTAFR
jgi:hypothetical protein